MLSWLYTKEVIMKISRICNLYFNNQGINKHSIVPYNFYSLARKMEGKKLVDFTLKENIRQFLNYHLDTSVEYDDIVYKRKPLYTLVNKDIFVMKLYAFSYMRLYKKLDKGGVLDFIKNLAEDYTAQEVISFVYSTVFNSYNDLVISDFQIITKLPVDFFSFKSGSSLLTPTVVRLAIGEDFITPNLYADYLLTQSEELEEKREAYKKYLKRWLLEHHEHKRIVVREYPDYQMMITARILKNSRYKRLMDFIDDNFNSTQAYYISFKNSNPIITERIELILKHAKTHPIDFFFNTILSKLDSLYNNSKSTREQSNRLREFISFHSYAKSLPKGNSF